MSSLTEFARKLSLKRSKPKKKKQKTADGRPTAAEAVELGYTADTAANSAAAVGGANTAAGYITVGTVEREGRPLILGTQPSRSEASVRRKEWDYENIILQKSGGGWGFNVAGGTDAHNVGRAREEGDNSIFVTKITEGGVAAQDGRLRVNDIIVSVNETSYNGLTHGEAVACLKGAGNTVHLALKRYRQERQQESVKGREGVGPIEVLLTKNGRGLGFNIAGGTDDQYKEGDDSIYITKLTEGGLAHSDGRIKVGDRILAVNDVRFDHVTHERAVAVLKATTQQVLLVLLREDRSKAHASSRRSSRSRSIDHLSTNTGPTNGPINGPPNGTTNGYTAVAAAEGRDRERRTERMESRDTEETISPPDSPVYAASRVMTAAVPAAAVVTPPGAITTPPAAAGRLTAAQAVNGSADWPQLVPEIMSSDDMPNFIQEPRQIVIKKRLTESLGFNIVGGKGKDGMGIFISSIIPGSVSDFSGKLKRGDQLLSVNGVDLRNATHEDAAAALKAVGETAVIITQYRIEEFNYLEQKIREVHARQAAERGTDIKLPVLQRVVFFRTLSDYDSRRDTAVQFGKGLNYEFGDILHVIIPQDGSDWWQARRVLPHRASDQQSGIIPSRRKMEERNGVNLRPKKPESIADSDRGEVLTKERNRRSFILSKKLSFNSLGSRFRKTSTPDMPQGNTAAAFGSATPISPLQAVLYYQPVVQMLGKYTRPVIILGVMKEQINNDLIRDFPDKFASCVPHTTRPRRREETDGLDYHFVSDRSAIERDIEANKFIEVGVYLDQLYAMSVESVMTVAKQKKHCILDVTVNAVPRLESAELYPITILVKPLSYATVSLVHRPIAEETARRIHQQAVKIYDESKHLLTAVVAGDTHDEIYTKVKEIIWMNSEPQIWVSSNDPSYFI